jgi:aryl-alcohol dehydrogenase-like predicted oxidoreductase
MYGKESYLKYLEEYARLAEESGNSKAGLAYRWVVWNSVLGEEGDCVVLGASSAGQLRETVREIEKGPLEPWVLEKLNAMFKGIENDDPGDNFTTFKKLRAEGVLEGVTTLKTDT